MIILLLSTITCVSATQINETSKVSDLNSIGDIYEINSSNNDFSTLSNEINASYQTKSLDLTKDYLFNEESDGNYTEGILIDIDNLVIDGHGHTINANKQARIFNINSNNVILKNIIIINGISDTHGGAIYWAGSNGSVCDSIFKNCKSPNSGGAIYFKKTATVKNSKFDDNEEEVNPYQLDSENNEQNNNGKSDNKQNNFSINDFEE